jgi:hypothetical protein
MKKTHYALLFIGFATHATAAISASGDESLTNYILLNGRVVPIEANVALVQHSLLGQMTMNMKSLEPSEESAQILGNEPFLPMEGIYDKSKVIYERLCTVSDSPNAVESVTSVVDVDAENATFIIRETSPDNPELVFDTLCELDGHNYRCDMPTQEVDFASFGLDAVVTIEGSEYGTWKWKKQHIHIPGQKFSCEGADCGIEPALSFFGTLTEEMPCASLAVYKYKWQSTLPTQSDGTY